MANVKDAISRLESIKISSNHFAGDKWSTLVTHNLNGCLFSMSTYLSSATGVAYSIMMRKIVHYGQVVVVP